MQLTDRTSGILLHISSIPGSSCCGSLGSGARRLVDFLHAAGQSWLQMLPVNPIDECHSPYASISAFAGEPIYIDLEELVEEGLLDQEDIAWEPDGPQAHAAYSVARDYRETRLKKAFERFKTGNGGLKYRKAYDKFLEENRSWVMPHAIFCTLSEDFGTHNWSTWPDLELRRADPKAIEKVCA
ncbi:MAG: 4-alpha-glucanotransferase, partial [Thermoguttaceae bacterium]